MIRISSAVFLLLFTLQANAQLNMSLVGQLDYPFNTNDIWGYAAPDGEEYALVGTTQGLSIVAIDSDPIEEVLFLSGSNSTWRDMKTWADHAYVATEAGDGLMVADLSDLPVEAPHYFWKPAIERPNQPGVFDTLRSIHNIFIDEFGILHITGSNINNGGVIFVDVNTSPGEPQVIGLGPSTYSHDSYGRDSILYSSEIYAGSLGIYDYSDLSNIELLAVQQTPFLFTHNAWLSDDSQTVFTTDERGNAPVAAYDISDLTNIQELDRYIPAQTAGQGVTPHNVHVWNDWLIISYYSDGGKIVDASRPDNLVEVGNFDTFFNLDPGFGAWGAYPFLPSERVLITDSGNGLFVLEPTYVRAAFLEGTVKGRNKLLGGNEEIVALINAQVQIVSEEIILPELTKAGGVFKMGKAISGKFEVEVSADGYITWGDSVIFENGVVTELDIILESNATTSIGNDPVINSQVKVFPIPATNEINIDLQKLDRELDMIRFSDVTGRILYNTNDIKARNVVTIPTGNLESGIYFVEIVTSDGARATKKVLLNHR